MEYGCIGERLTHSFSKEIHAKLFSYDYTLCELTRDEVGEFLKKREFKAINVTIPYKQTVMPYLDEISETAKKIGAVNTVVNRGGRLCGYNTDFYGMRALIERMGLCLDGKKVLVLGSGGTSKTAAAVAESMGAKKILRVSRAASNDTVTYDEAKSAHADADIIINTTPCGMYPNGGTAAIDLDDYSSVSGVVDAVYNPLRSALVVKAKEKGIAAEGGLYMLVAQAVFAAELFTGEKIPREKIDSVFNEIYSRKQNLVLTGMPGCGKSTLGKMAARELSLGFVDTDEEIVKKAGKPIPQIFSDDGEKAFRDLESEVVREVSALQGTVIATGGGAVLRRENINALRENGRVLFLDRSIEKLVTTSDRPLSSDREKLEKRYAERYDIYCATADAKIDCVDEIEKNILKIKEAFLNEAFGN